MVAEQSHRRLVRRSARHRGLGRLTSHSIGGIYLNDCTVPYFWSCQNPAVSALTAIRNLNLPSPHVASVRWRRALTASDQVFPDR